MKVPSLKTTHTTSYCGSIHLNRASALLKKTPTTKQKSKKDSVG